MNAICYCGQPCDGTYACGSCTTEAWNALDRLPALLVELDVARTRQVRLTDGTGRTSGSPLPWNESASAMGLRLAARLWALVSACADAHLASTEAAETEPWPRLDTDRGAARWLMCRVEALARVPWGANEMRRLVHLTKRGWHLVDHPPERIFAGPCSLCGHDLYATPGEPVVVCAACQTPEDVDRRREFLLAKVDDQLVTATEMARALTTLGQPVTPERIRQWKHRGRILSRGSSAAGVPVYRVGDVVSLLVAETERAAERAAERSGNQAV